MSDHIDLMLRAVMMPRDLTELRWVLAQARIRGLECAAEDARIFGHGEFADHLLMRTMGVRDEAINRPPPQEVFA